MNILIADDNPTNLKLLRAHLETAGHTVLEARDGVESLDILNRERVDAVISDILMPRMDGYRLCYEMRRQERFKHLPFIIYTSTYTSPGDERLALDVGADKYLKKPASAAALAAALHEVESSRAERHHASKVTMPEVEMMKEYSQRLVDKLEEKAIELAATVEQLQASEGQLRESEARFRELAENIEEVLWITDPAKEQIVYVSPAYERIFGRTCESLYAGPLTWLEALHPEDRDRVHAAALTKQTRGDYDETYRILKPDGSVRWIRDRAFPLRNATGGVYRVVGTAIDITDARKLEEQLRHSQKMDAIGRLSGGVAHDFNNILCVILGHASILQTEDLSVAERADSLQQIAQAGERAATLTRQLLACSRHNVMQRRPLDLNDVTANMIKMLQRLIGEDIVLQTVYASGGAQVHADPGMMEQVLLNLAVNARDAMPDGGEISILTERVRLDEAGSGQRPNQQTGEFIRLSVRDTGCGIPKEVLPRVFEPFFTTKEAGEGTGLGLATVFGIVEQHHGWIETESEVGRGTTFHIFLPRLADSSVQLVGQEAAVRVSGGHETILVVDDEPSIRALTRYTLERYGYRVHEAGNGPAALELWRQECGSVDLLFTDIVMPGGVSGRELAARLLAEKPQLKLIYTSGYPGDIAGRGLSLREGINFLQKPYSPLQLAEIVRNALDAQ